MTTPGSGQPPWDPPPGDQPWQAPQPTAPLPGYGEAPSPPPPPAGYGPPAGGYGAFPPPPPLPPLPPPAPPRPRNRAPIIAAAAIAAVAVIALALIFGLQGDKKNPTHAAVGSTGGSSSANTDFPTTFSTAASDATSTSASGATIAVADARAVIVQYLDDINAQDRTAAKALICSDLVSKWETTIDQPGGDFTVSVTRATFQNSAATSAGMALRYTLEVKAIDTDQAGTSQVTFTVVNAADGLRLCGES